MTYNLTEQQVRKLIEDSWDCCESFHFNYASNNKEKHTAYELATLQQSAPASSVGEKDLIDIINKAINCGIEVTNIQDWEERARFVEDFKKAYYPFLRAEEAPKEDEKNPTELELSEFIKGAFQVLVGMDKYKMMDFILDSKFRIVYGK